MICFWGHDDAFKHRVPRLFFLYHSILTIYARPATRSSVHDPHDWAFDEPSILIDLYIGRDGLVGIEIEGGVLDKIHKQANVHGARLSDRNIQDDDQRIVRGHTCLWFFQWL